MSVPKPLSRLTDIKDIKELIGSFLKAPDLGSFSQSSKELRFIFSKQLSEMELLKAVFDADPKRVKEILAKPKPRPYKSKSIVLIKTHVKETYFSKKIVGKKFFVFNHKEWKMICKREWKNISPLEAAAWCGDTFLVKELLEYIPKSQLQEAYNQLKGILERKESEEHGAYLAPFRKLINAYEDYDRQYDHTLCYPPEDCLGLKDRWITVWECQKRLPTYGLQEFCDDKPFSPLPSFDKEPKRSYPFKGNWFYPSDLDSMYRGDALHKSKNDYVKASGWSLWVGFHGPSNLDQRAISHLCEVRMQDLIKIIKELEHLLPIAEPQMDEDETNIKDVNKPL